MQFEYDQESDALYIRLVEDAMVARTEQIDAGTLVDVNEGGAAVGIEIIRPARPIPVNEIADRFPLIGDEIRVLRSLWAGNDRVFPYAVPERIAAAG